ncbi:MAG: hypothetical protein ABI859_00310 [Pseudomonadota bacterium]
MRLATMCVMGVLAAGPIAVPVAMARAQCDHTCLNGFVDQYLAALEAHDPGRLPLAAHVRFTENGQQMALGDGLWGTVSGADQKQSRIYFNDPRLGQAGFIGVVDEGGSPVTLFLRLKVVQGRISEVETIAARKERTQFSNPEAILDKPVFSEIMAPEQRRSRKQMEAILHAYLEAQINAKYNEAIFDPACQRVEGGIVTANNPDGDKMGKLSCGEQLKTGVSALLTRAREPRVFVADEERGLIGAVFFFDHAGTHRTVEIKYADGTTAERTSSSTAPYSWMAGELFKIRNGRILQIEIVIVKVPYRMSSGWPGGGKEVVKEKTGG